MFALSDILDLLQWKAPTALDERLLAGHRERLDEGFDDILRDGTDGTVSSNGFDWTADRPVRAPKLADATPIDIRRWRKQPRSVRPRRG